jgi:hypothetical protein
MDHYLRISENQKKDSYILAGTSVTLILGFFVADGINNKIDADGKTFVIASCAFLASAYALRIASLLNHKKALRLSAKLIKTTVILGKQSTMFTQSFPALALNFNLSR